MQIKHQRRIRETQKSSRGVVEVGLFSIIHSNLNIVSHFSYNIADYAKGEHVNCDGLLCYGKH